MDDAYFLLKACVFSFILIVVCLVLRSIFLCLIPKSTCPHLAGDNFFKSANYTVEIMCAASFSKEKEKLRAVEAKLLTKRAELSKFEAEYKDVSSKP